MHHPALVTSLIDWLQSSANMAVAFLLGAVIGYERQYRQRTAGLRTNTLVALAASTFVDLAYQLNGAAGATQAAAYVISGVGFLGAGTIMKEGMNVRGLNTAATLWGSAAAGACAGASMFGQAVTTALLVLAANTLLRPLVNAINASPINARSTEVSYRLAVIVPDSGQKEALSLLEHLVEHAGQAFASIEVAAFGESDVEISGLIHAHGVESTLLDHMVAQLSAQPLVKQAFWTPQVSD